VHIGTTQTKSFTDSQPSVVEKYYQESITSMHGGVDEGIDLGIGQTFRGTKNFAGAQHLHSRVPKFAAFAAIE